MSITLVQNHIQWQITTTEYGNEYWKHYLN